jgi:hypothetical protein
LFPLDERLDVLLHVKWTVKEFDCNLTRETVELIDREADLLNRGRDPRSMDGLRRRVANLFLQVCVGGCVCAFLVIFYGDGYFIIVA